MENLVVGVNAVSCPLCRQTVPFDAFERHLQNHGIKTRLAIKPRVIVEPYAVAEWGKRFWEWGRRLISGEEDVHHSEGQYTLTDTAGNPTPFPSPWEMIYKTVDELRRNGIRPQYIRIERENMLVQASGSPIKPWIIYLIVAAVAALLFGVAFYLAANAFYQIFVAPIPPEWRPFFYLGIICVVGLLAVAYITRRKS